MAQHRIQKGNLQRNDHNIPCRQHHSRHNANNLIIVIGCAMHILHDRPLQPVAVRRHSPTHAGTPTAEARRRLRGQETNFVPKFVPPDSGDKFSLKICPPGFGRQILFPNLSPRIRETNFVSKFVPPAFGRQILFQNLSPRIWETNVFFRKSRFHGRILEM